LANLPIGGVSFCTWLLVDPMHQRQGIGSQLIMYWEQFELNKGAHRLCLYTKKKNLGFYNKLGYSQVSFMEKAWWGNDAYTMSKLLCEPEGKNFLK